MKAKLAVIVATALLLVGCSSINTGQITHKSYSPAYDYWTQQCTYYDKGVCKVWMPIQNHVEEKYKFDIRNDNDDTGWVYVSPGEYEQYEIGDYYGEKR